MDVLKRTEERMEHKKPGLCQIYRDIFGTDNPEELREIAKRAMAYEKMMSEGKPVNTREAGRKERFSEQEAAEMIERYHQGETISALAKRFSTSRQTIYKYLEPERRFEQDPFIMMRMEYLYRNQVCTIIDVDFFHKKIYICNKTRDILHRAFGVIEEPTWDDFEHFLESRCFPPTRAHVREILEDLGLDSYDPIQIIEKTEGRMAEDKQWIRLHYREEVLEDGICRFKQRYQI